ncbi:MAG: phage minor head protein, partial [Planctomycetota bacterium]
MTAIAMMLLATMSTAELERAEGLIGDILGDVLFVKAQAEDARVAKFRKGYAKALAKVLGARFEELDLAGEVDEVMERAGGLFGPAVAEKLAPDIRRYLKGAFRLGQKVDVVPDKVKTVWDKPRQEALDWLVRHDRFWIGKVFPDHLAGDFRETITAGLEEGLGRKDIGLRLRDMVMGKPGAPAKLEYYTRVAATTVNRARNWGGVFSLHAAGFTEYEVRSVLDERTSHICREMSGKTFRVRDAMDLVQRAIDSPPSAIEELAPWPRYDSERGDHYLTIGGSREYLAGKNTQWLAGHGLSLPPFHGNCRSTYVVTSAQVSEHREVVEPAAPPFDVSELSPVTMRLDGMHEKKVFEDAGGNRWLFKPVGRGEEFRAWGDRAAAELAKELGLPTPEVYVTEIGGKAGSLQKMFDVAGSFRGVAPGALSPDELVAIQREHAFDWLISNHDAHPGNMIRTKDGKLVGIDKGQLFRFFGKDRLAVAYNPNPEPSLYNGVFAAYAEGKDVALAPLAHGKIKELLGQLDALSDDDFRRILSPYAKRAAEAGRLAYGTEKAFLRKALARKKSLAKDLEAFYRQINTKRAKALGGRSAPRKAFTKVDAGFVRRVKAAGTHGQSLLVAGDDFENMNLLA